jgi:hypothetical protein
MIKVMTNHTTKWEFYFIFGKILKFFYKPTKAHKQWNNSFETQQGITLAHMQKLSKIK